MKNVKRIAIAALVIALAAGVAGVAFPRPAPVVEELGTSNYTSDNNVFSGSVAVGDGSPSVTQDGEDLYVEDQFEVDGEAQFDGSIDANGGIVLAGGALDLNDALDIDGSADEVQLAVTGYTTQTSDLVQFDGGLTDIGGGSYGVADGDNDLGIAGVLEVDTEIEADGPVDIDGSSDAVQLSITGYTTQTNDMVQLDGGLVDVGGGSYDTADGDNDLGVAGDLEVDGELELDGALDADSTANFGGTVTFAAGTILLTEAASAADTITAAECGKTFFMSGDDYTLTLPAVSGVSAGCEFRFIVATAPTTSTVVLTGDSDEDVLIGGINELDVDTGNDGPYDANADTITFVGGTAAVGDYVYMICDGSYYYIHGQANADGGVTITDSE